MYDREMKIKHWILKRGNDTEYFDVTRIPNNVYGAIDNCCDYERIMETINESYPDSIVIDPEGFKALTVVRFLYDTHSNYDSSVRKVQRGGEFVEKYVSYELLLHLKPKVKRELKK
jgi:hypothetical protein